MMSSAATSSPVSESTLAYLMRWPVLRLIWLKLTFSVSDVAGYSATGQVTSERRKKPFQLARGAMGYSENATDKGTRIPPGNRVSSDRGGNSRNDVNRGGMAPRDPEGVRGVAGDDAAAYPERPVRRPRPKARNIIWNRALLLIRDAAPHGLWCDT